MCSRRSRLAIVRSLSEWHWRLKVKTLGLDGLDGLSGKRGREKWERVWMEIERDVKVILRKKGKQMTVCSLGSILGLF